MKKIFKFSSKNSKAFPVFDVSRFIDFIDTVPWCFIARNVRKSQLAIRNIPIARRIGILLYTKLDKYCFVPCGTSAVFFNTSILGNILSSRAWRRNVNKVDNSWDISDFYIKYLPFQLKISHELLIFFLISYLIIFWRKMFPKIDMCGKKEKKVSFKRMKLTFIRPTCILPQKKLITSNRVPFEIIQLLSEMLFVKIMTFVVIEVVPVTGLTLHIYLCSCNIYTFF